MESQPSEDAHSLPADQERNRDENQVERPDDDNEDLQAAVEGIQDMVDTFGADLDRALITLVLEDLLHPNRPTPQADVIDLLVPGMRYVEIERYRCGRSVNVLLQREDDEWGTFCVPFEELTKHCQLIMAPGYGGLGGKGPIRMVLQRK